MREVHEQIRRILLKDWDPIPVLDEPRAQDEYDDYVPGVYRLLLAGASAREVAEHLIRIEADKMGMAAPVDRLPVATKLCALIVKR